MLQGFEKEFQRATRFSISGDFRVQKEYQQIRAIVRYSSGTQSLALKLTAKQPPDHFQASRCFPRNQIPAFYSLF